MSDHSLAPEFNPALTPVPVRSVPNAKTGPQSSVHQGVEDIDNSEVRKIAQDVLGQFKYSVVAVAANPEADVQPDTVEMAFKQALDARGEAKRAQYKQAAEPIAKADPAVRQRLFGRMGASSPTDVLSKGTAGLAAQLPGLKIDPKLVGLASGRLGVPVDLLRRTDEGFVVDLEGFGDFEDVDALTEAMQTRQAEAVRTKVNAAKLSDIWGRNFFPDEALETPGGDFEDFESTNPDRFNVDVRTFKCVDETNPEWWGSDEYSLGGSAIDESGDVRKVAERYIGGGFDDGDQKWLGWDSWTTFSLHGGGGFTKGWPKTYRAILLLAEKDNGGFASFLSDLYGRVRDRVKDAITAAVTGALSGYVGVAIAAAIGKAVAWIVDQLIGWLINLFNDDIFPAVLTTMRHVSPSGRFTVNGVWGSKISPTYRAQFYGHGGHGMVEYRWRLHD